MRGEGGAHFVRDVNRPRRLHPVVERPLVLYKLVNGEGDNERGVILGAHDDPWRICRGLGRNGCLVGACPWLKWVVG